MRPRKYTASCKSQLKDLKNKENISINDPNKNAKDVIDETAAMDSSDQKRWIESSADRQKPLRDNFQAMREYHGANHALYYLNLLVDSLIYGKLNKNSCRNFIRLRTHMMNLREFIGNDQREMMLITGELLRDFEKSSLLRRRKELAVILFKKWALMSVFAAAYTKDQNLFSEERCTKLKDVLFGRCYFRQWWWASQLAGLRNWCKRFMRGEALR